MADTTMNKEPAHWSAGNVSQHISKEKTEEVKSIIMPEKVTEDSSKTPDSPPPATEDDGPGYVERAIEYSIEKADQLQDAVLFKEDDFPICDRVIGLPPIYTDGGGFINIEAEMLNAFPILTVQPMNYSLTSPDQKLKNAEMEKLNRIFKIAIQPNNNITYSHSNTYSPSAIEEQLQQLMTFSTSGEVRQLLNVGGGVFGGEDARKIMNYVPQLVGQSLTAIDEAVKERYKKDEISAPTAVFSHIGQDVLRNLLLGARTDFPNIWSGSNTGLSWNFTVELRTFATDVESEMYINDIILPMDVFLSLSLPKGGQVMSYIEPPYISAFIPNLLDVRIGAISNISWNVPLSDLNKVGLPRHIEIQFTITDLYSVMIQSKGAEESNPDFPNRYRFINMLKQKPEKTIANEDLWKYEYFRKAPTTSEKQTDSKLPGAAGATTTKQASNVFDVDMEDGNFGDAFARNYNWQYPNVEYNANTKNMGFSLPNLVNKDGTPGAVVANIPNVKNISGLDINKAVAGVSQSIDLTNKNISVAMNTKINPFGNNLNTLIGNVTDKISSNLSNVLNSANINTITKGLMSQPMDNVINSLSTTTANIVKDILQNIDGTALNIKSPMDLLSSTISNIDSQLVSIMNGDVVKVDDLLRNVVADISKLNTKLDSELRLSPILQQTLSQSTESIVKDVINNTAVRQDMLNLINEGKSKVQSSEELPKDVKTAISNVLDVASAVINSSTMEGIMSSSDRTNSESAIRVGDKS